MTQFVFVDQPITSTPTATTAGALVLTATGMQEIDGLPRTYYAARPPYRLLLVLRHGVTLAAVQPGCYLAALIGWDDGRSSYTMPADAGKRHTKLSVDAVLPTLPSVPSPVLNLTALLARVPRSDRPGGVRSAAQAGGRPRLTGSENVEAHNVTLPARLWRRIEDAGQGNRSAGVRVLLEPNPTLEFTMQLPYEIRRLLRAIPGGTAFAAEVNGQTALVVKMAQADATDAHRLGVVVAVQPQLGLYPQAAVLRLACEFRDQVDAPLHLDTFLDPTKTADAALLHHLTQQDILDFHIYDTERLNYQYTKRIPWREKARRELADLLDQARAHAATIPPAERNWQAARDAMWAETD